MTRYPTSAALRRSVLSTVPSLAGWGSFRRASVNIFAFALAVSTATWIVHQTEYLIEYGNRFSTVMASGPRHTYMRPTGLVLACMAAIAIFTVIILLGSQQSGYALIILRLPTRLKRRLRVPIQRMEPISILRTAAVLATFQLVMYVLQENTEQFLSIGRLPGLSVIAAPEHLTVIPLHLLAAVFAAMLLWTTSLWLGRARQIGRLARLLTRILRPLETEDCRQCPESVLGMRRRTAGGAHGVRGPPSAA